MAKITLNEYGANRAYETALAGPFAKLAGTSRLYRSDKGPAGVLYRPISTIREALSCGGLMLMSADGAVWQFWVGQDLVDAMAWEQIGQRPVFTRYAADINPSGHQGWTGPNVVNHDTIVLPSVDVRLVLDKDATFPTTGVVYAAGIITSAQYGMGSTVFEGFDHSSSYMATVDSLDRTFEQFMATAKVATLEAAPSKVRGYYERAFPQVMASFDRRLLHPSVSVSTQWTSSGALAANLVDYTINEYLSDGQAGAGIYLAARGFGLAYSNDVAGINAMIEDQLPAVKARWVGRAKSVDTTWSPAVGFGVGAPIHSTYADDNGTQRVQNPLMVRHRTGAGTVSHWRGSWKGFTTVGKTATGGSGYATLPNQTGVVQGLRCGWFRDYHTLDRSVNQVTREHLAAPNYGTLSGLVIATMGKQAMNASAPAELTTMAEANDALADTSASRGLRYSTPLIRGTLLDTIERFSDAWDAKAEELARADR